MYYKEARSRGWLMTSSCNGSGSIPAWLLLWVLNFKYMFSAQNLNKKPQRVVRNSLTNGKEWKTAKIKAFWITSFFIARLYAFDNRNLVSYVTVMPTEPSRASKLWCELTCINYQQHNNRLPWIKLVFFPYSKFFRVVLSGRKSNQKEKCEPLLFSCLHSWPCRKVK